MTDSNNSKAPHPAQDLAMSQLVEELVQQHALLWWESDADVLPTMPTYTRREQRTREKDLQRFVDTLTSELRHPPRTELQRQNTRELILSAFEDSAGPALDLEKRHMDVLLSSSLPQAAIEFAQMARGFDPTISNASIFQASRGAWSMYGLQLLLGQPVQLTPAIFAYCMIYPYSDNYLDDLTIPTETKAAFNERLTRRLAGEDIAPTNAHEQTIWKLVGMIEDQFDRVHFPQVFEGLLAIHRAQCKSLALLCQDASTHEIDVLGISIEKGGASVLAAGYLVAGILCRAEREFMFGFGALLQLVDDLQDVQQDRKAGLSTVFSQTAERWPLDGLTNRTLAFGAKVLECLNAFDAPGLDPLKELMKRSALLLLIEAAGHAARLYSQSYLRELETHSPTRFPFQRKLRQKLSHQQKPLARLIEALAMSGDAAPLGAWPRPRRRFEQTEHNLRHKA